MFCFATIFQNFSFEKEAAGFKSLVHTHAFIKFVDDIDTGFMDEDFIVLTWVQNTNFSIHLRNVPWQRKVT